MSREQLARTERGVQERVTAGRPKRPMAKVICKNGPAISIAKEPASCVDSYVRHNDGFGHNPNLR